MPLFPLSPGGELVTAGGVSESRETPGCGTRDMPSYPEFKPSFRKQYYPINLI